MVELSVGGTTFEIIPPNELEERVQARRKHNPQRLEDLSPKDGNTPSGRGADTASSRGYDTEQLVSSIYDGTTENRESWYDVEATWTSPEGTELKHLIECKSCIDHHPNGEAGSFRLWKKNHNRLLEAEYRTATEDVVTSYVFLVYTIIDEEAVEIGKFRASAYHIEEIVGDWNFIQHETMGYEPVKNITWTTLTEELGIPAKTLHQAKPHITDPDPKVAPGNLDTIRELKQRFDY